MDMQFIINQMAVLFLLLATGYIVGKLKVLTPDGSRALTRVILYVSLPCTILYSVFDNRLDVAAGDLIFYMLMCFLAFLLAFTIAIPIVRLSRGNKRNHGLLTYMSVFSNCGFMGFPVALAIFGSASGLYTAIFNIPFNLLSFSIGILLIAGKGEKFRPKLLLNPSFIAALLVIPITLFDIRLPYIFTEAMRFTGGITTPGAMIIIGSTLSFIPVRNVFSEWRVWLTSMLRLVLIPLATWFVFRLFITDTLMLGVLVILSAMPTAAQSTMLAIEHDGNEQIASAGVFITTLLCVVTVPLLVYTLFM